jgi:hypothetical protein
MTDEPDPDDGADPRRFHDRRRRPIPSAAPQGPSRKARQLCGQVKDVLTVALADCGDGMLQSLTVVCVEPAPNSGRLAVTVAVPAPAVPADRARATDRLSAALHRLRQEVAAGVHRKYAPELVVRVV